MLISALLILSFNLITSALQHEKSFMFDSTASSVFAIALYKRSLLITSSTDVIQKDIETGIFQRKFVAHSSIIESILVVNGTKMITTGGDDMVIVWDLISGSIMKRIWLEAPMTFPSSMAIKNSDVFVSGRDGKVRIVNFLFGRVATRIDLEVPVVAIRVKDNHFYVGKQDSTSQLEKYSIPTRSLLLSYEGHQSSVFTLFLQGVFLFSGSFDSTIICWNEENGQIIRIFSGHSTAVWVIAIIDDYLYSASEPEGIFKWNIDSGAIENIFPVSHLNTIYCFAFENGTLYSGSTDTTVIRWDLRTSSKLFTYGGRKTKLRALVLWKNVVLAAGDGPVLTIQDKSQNTLFPVEIISGHESDVLCMIMINDTFFTGGVDATIRRRSFIDFSDIKIYNGNFVQREFNLVGHSLAVSSLVLDENYMYSGSYDFTLKQWNIASGSIENDYIGHERDIWSIQVQGQFLYSGSLDSSVMIWDKESAAMVKAIGCKFL
jgi:WD40 repeat protein